MTAVIATSQTILVVGGGISGMTAALEAAECGRQVVLVERNPTLGGRTALLYRYFPKMCHPTCGLEINLRRLKAQPQRARADDGRGHRRDRDARRLPRDGHGSGRATSTRTAPPAATARRRSAAEIPNPYNYGLDQIKAAYLPHAMAYPQRYVLDPSIIGTPDADKAKAACKYGAIDLEMQEETIELKVGAVVWATGWKPYDAAKIQPYGYGRFANVITSVEFERLADPGGPTGGKLLRPSDGKEAKNIAFIQCAGSRDENHLRHCSRICCMASLKQTQYVREAWGDDGEVDRLLHRHPRDRPLRGFLPDGAEGSDGDVRQVQGGAHRDGRSTGNVVAARRGHRGLPSLRDRARSRRAGDRHGTGKQRHRASGGHRPRFERLHRRRGRRRPVRCRRVVVAARRQPVGAKRHRRGAARDPGDPQSRQREEAYRP